MTNRLNIPNEASKFILFQRTNYIIFNKNLTYKVLRKLLPFATYERLVEFEAKIRNSKIKTQYLDDMRKEYLSIKEVLPKNCARVLDIGCGVAGIDIYLSRHYENMRIDFFLLDKTYTEERVFYMFEERGAFYNSLEIARRVLVNNGVDEARIHLVQATDSNDINVGSGGVDLILSLVSWGFHYPVQTYLENAYELLNKGGTLILDIRKGTNELHLLSRKFGRYKTILEEKKYTRVCAIK